MDERSTFLQRCGMVALLLSILALFAGGCVARGGVTYVQTSDQGMRETIAKMVALNVLMAFALAFVAGRLSIGG